MRIDELTKVENWTVLDLIKAINTTCLKFKTSGFPVIKIKVTSPRSFFIAVKCQGKLFKRSTFIPAALQKFTNKITGDHSADFNDWKCSRDLYYFSLNRDLSEKEIDELENGIDFLLN